LRSRGIFKGLAGFGNCLAALREFCGAGPAILDNVRNVCPDFYGGVIGVIAGIGNNNIGCAIAGLRVVELLLFDSLIFLSITGP
jgi:hypothetical protein